MFGLVGGTRSLARFLRQALSKNSDPSLDYSIGQVSRWTTALKDYHYLSYYFFLSNEPEKASVIAYLSAMKNHGGHTRVKIALVHRPECLWEVTVQPQQDLDLDLTISFNNGKVEQGLLAGEILYGTTNYSQILSQFFQSLPESYPESLRQITVTQRSIVLTFLPIPSSDFSTSFNFLETLISYLNHDSYVPFTLGNNHGCLSKPEDINSNPISIGLQNKGYKIKYHEPNLGNSLGVLKATHPILGSLTVRSYDDGWGVPRYSISLESRTTTDIELTLNPLMQRRTAAEFFQIHPTNNLPLRTWLEKSNDNVDQIISFLHSKGLLLPLTALLMDLDYLFLNGPKMVLNIGVRSSLVVFLHLMDWVEDLCEALGLLVKEVVYDSFCCSNCQRQISFHRNVCPNCNTPTPRCVICWGKPEPNEEIIRLSCCQTYAHRRHVKEWLLIRPYCPVCGQRKPSLVPVRDTPLEV